MNSGDIIYQCSYVLVIWGFLLTLGRLCVELHCGTVSGDKIGPVSFATSLKPTKEVLIELGSRTRC